MLANLKLIATAAFLFFFRLYMILPSTTKKHSETFRTPSDNCTVAVFLGSGGHTSEALTLISALDSQRYNRRIYIVGEGDNLSMQKAVNLEEKLGSDKDHFSILSIPRARQVHQALLATPRSALHSLIICSYYLTLQPLLSLQRQRFADILILNGPGTCFILCVSVYINKFLGLHAPVVVYVESFARVKSLSLSAKLIRPFADHFITQWSQSQSSESALTPKHWLV